MSPLRIYSELNLLASHASPLPSLHIPLPDIQLCQYIFIHASPLPSLPIPLPDTQPCQYTLFMPLHCLPYTSLYLILNHANTHYSYLPTAFPPHPSTKYSTLPIHIIHASPLPSLPIPLPNTQLCQYTLFMPLHCLPSPSLYLILNYANTHYSYLPTAFPPHPST